MSSPHSGVPDIPGALQYEPTLGNLKQYVANLLQMRSYRFPGAQPVSFTQNHLRELESEDYFVAEKSDGVRCLALITVNRETRAQEVYLFDRKSNFFLIPNLRFPIPNDPSFQKCHTDTIIDGELVLDREPDGRVRQRLLLFDCLVIAGKILVERDLSKRLGYLKMDILRPYQQMLQKRPDIASSQPFSVEFKEQQFSYHLDTIFNDIIPNLKHGNDGLIFTSVNGPYSLGTCETMLKWKPANENSIDFKISLEFPPSGTIPGVVDTTAKPRIALWVWRGGRDYIPFGEMGVTDEEWFRDFSPIGRTLQGRIVECNYDVEAQQRLGLSSPWRFMRYRADKPDANHKSTVDKVLNSIRDGITQQELVERTPQIRQAWNHRKHQ
ncbi:mRNA capping enzyme, catalytic domain-containing protein [Umbelopsis sp. PMI_123]|nr:mRNA capping enzyme, catalytic domain-containing protein [Umbelopsis sp. PMI_123]